MLIMPSFQNSLIVEQCQGNYLKFMDRHFNLAPGVQTMDSAIRRINPVDKSQRNQLRYPMDSDLSDGSISLSIF